MKKARVKHSKVKVKASAQSTLGGLIGLVRRQNEWTLREMSEKVGIPLSTLAKVEADKLSLTYDKLQQFTSRLGLTMTEFLARGEAPVAASVVTARRSLAIGDKVRILGGSFASMLGLVDGVSDRDRVSILVDLLGRKVRVTLDAPGLEKTT